MLPVHRSRIRDQATGGQADRCVVFTRRPYDDAATYRLLAWEVRIRDAAPHPAIVPAGRGAI